MKILGTIIAAALALWAVSLIAHSTVGMYSHLLLVVLIVLVAIKLLF
jgi:hypothetical protein